MMNRSSSLLAGLARAALLVVLVAAQGAAIAHEFTHSHQSAQELCASCSLSNHLEATVTAETHCDYAPETGYFTADPVQDLVNQGVQLPYNQRAPPVSL